jgi:hypothetical protein
MHPIAGQALIVAFIFLAKAEAYADAAPNEEWRAANKACSENSYKFADSVHRIGQEIERRSVDNNSRSGDIAYNSVRVWDRDIRMIMHYFNIDIRTAAADPGVTIGKCNNVISFYSRCVDELYGNVIAKISVQHPTTGCLGRLYDTYHLTDDDYYHGR